MISELMIEIKKQGPLSAETVALLISKIPEGKGLVVSDDACVLCNRLIVLLLKADREKRLLFTTFGSSLFNDHDTQQLMPQSLIYISHTGTYTESGAVLEICHTIPQFALLTRVMKFIPVSVRDALYRLVARYRYRIFGKTTKCVLPKKEDAGRFIK